MACDRERPHTRRGSLGISVKKKNVLPALSPGLLRGFYKDWGEFIENKDIKVAEMGLRGATGGPRGRESLHSAESQGICCHQK